MKRTVLHTWVAFKFLGTQQALRGPVLIICLLEKQAQGLFILSFKEETHSENVKLKSLF